ncbi:levanase/fructan beta-fructosidase [Arcicella aurantiaca]|uniref:Levanase/fructan beta-fructosidase n=2 Tax=Arcicella aurantiaca TaxID=591202 RepID=A0A316E185_9BACT|nr:levanase/fructan beta-fructosidase [Arcicella aurantiaca]
MNSQTEVWVTKSMKKTLLLLLFPFWILAQTPKETPHWRPTYHFTAPQNWINDPNGMVYYQGEYHLFYQHNPFENKWGHMSWGHAVSKDLVKWEHLPVAIPEDSVWIFSGSAVVDKNNTSGFQTGSEPCMVALYTADYHDGKKEAQYLAYSNDRGRTWTKYAGNPVIDLHMTDFRDPHVIWHEPSQQWVMSVVFPKEFKVIFFTSKNLKNWTRVGEFGNQGELRKIWECPALVEMPVEGSPNKTKWVLMVSSNGTYDKFEGMQYFVGDFDGTNFKNDNSPETKLYVDYGKDFYAAIPYTDAPNNQKVFLGWMSSWHYIEAIKTSPWKGQMSAPRNIFLRQTSEGLRLFQDPVATLKPKKDYLVFEKKNFEFSKEKQLDGMTLFSQNAYMIEIEFEKKSASNFGLRIAQLKDKIDNKKILHQTIVGYDTQHSELYIDRTNSGVIPNNDFASVEKTNVNLKNNILKLKILVDKTSVEVFANDGEKVISDLIFPVEGSNMFSLFTSEKKVKVLSLKISDLSK